MVYFFPFSSFWGENTFQIEFRMKSKLLYELRFYVLHDLQANLPQTSPFSICPNGFSEKLPSNVYSTWDVRYRVTLFLEQNQASCAIHLIQGHHLGENLGKTFGILQKLKYALQSQCLQQQLEIVIKHMQHGFAIVFLAGFTAFISKSYAFCWCVVQTGWLACQLKHQTRFVHSTIPSRYRDKLEV